MLTELKLTNFRIFDDEITVRFRPITILIGRNSSGKSSIVKFLLMLQQSSSPGRSRFLTTEGEKVRLGAFPELKNSITRRRNLVFELTANTPNDQPNELLRPYLIRLGEPEHSDLLYRAQATVSYSRKSSIASSSYSLVAQPSSKDLLKIENRHLEGTSFGELSSQSEWNQLVSNPRNNGNITKLSHEQWERRLELLEISMAELDIVSEIRHQINALRHLSPVRDESQRVILASHPADDSVGQTGQHTLPHLQEIVNENGGRYEFILPHLRNVADIENVNFRTSSGYVSRAMAKNRKTNAEVLIADFGFGVGQCLPVLVQGAIMDPQTTLMVEQPESQLHPTAQLELGSYFADLWKQRKVTSIIETHSDNILLRLRRLIAKGKLSHEDVSVAYFTFDEENRNMPIIKNLDINEDGSMEAGLPMEFFGADVIEGLKLGARA